MVAFVKSVGFNKETGIEEKMNLKGSRPPTDVLRRGPNNSAIAWVNHGALSNNAIAWVNLAHGALRFQKRS